MSDTHDAFSERKLSRIEYMVGRNIVLVPKKLALLLGTDGHEDLGTDVLCQLNGSLSDSWGTNQPEVFASCQIEVNDSPPSAL